MDIKPDLLYSVKEASELLGVHPRKMTRIGAKHNIEKIDNRYLFYGRFLISYRDLDNVKRMSKDVEGLSKDVKQEDVIGKKFVPFKTTNAGPDIQELRHDIQESHQEKLKRAIELITIESAKQNLNHKVFTEEEYIDLIGTLDRVEYQQEQIQYLRQRVEKQDEILTNLFKTIEQRNYIEAKDKGHDSN